MENLAALLDQNLDQIYSRTDLDLENERFSRFTHMDRNLLQPLVHLEKISFTKMNLQSLDESVFVSQTQLKELVISTNQLQRLPGNLFLQTKFINFLR
jgi:hypothetical protein